MMGGRIRKIIVLMICILALAIFAGSKSKKKESLDVQEKKEKEISKVKEQVPVQEVEIIEMESGITYKGYQDVASSQEMQNLEDHLQSFEEDGYTAAIACRNINSDRGFFIMQMR